MTKTRVLLYKNGSKCGKRIVRALDATIKRGLSSREPIINWGSGVHRKVKCLPFIWLNKRECVDIASDKIKTFDTLRDANISIPKYTQHMDTAKYWCETGEYVYCRTLTRANQGRGIIMAKDSEDVVYAPLYTIAMNSTAEYRVHSFQGEVIGVSKKIPKENCIVDEDVRSNKRGWKFSKCDIDRVHPVIKQLGADAVDALGLDFGAVDLLWNSNIEKGYVLEVNTAPCLEEGSSIFNKYIEKFKEWRRIYDE